MTGANPHTSRAWKFTKENKYVFVCLHWSLRYHRKNRSLFELAVRWLSCGRASNDRLHKCVLDCPWYKTFGRKCYSGIAIGLRPRTPIWILKNNTQQNTYFQIVDSAAIASYLETFYFSICTSMSLFHPQPFFTQWKPPENKHTTMLYWKFAFEI